MSFRTFCLIAFGSWLVLFSIVFGQWVKAERAKREQLERQEVRLDCEVLSFPSAVLGTSAGQRIVFQCYEESSHDEAVSHF